LAQKPDRNKAKEDKRVQKDNIEMELKKLAVRVWNGLIWLIIGHVAGSCKRGNEPSGSIKTRKFFD
jgi:hypothetical protein